MATLTVALMDPPYETPATTTAFRIIESALQKGHAVNVFAYEGAVNLAMAGQAPHANPVKGTTAEEEDHPTTKDWVASLFTTYPGKVAWVNCGLCADERGANDSVPGPVRGSPKEFVEWVNGSDQTLVIPAK